MKLIKKFSITIASASLCLFSLQAVAQGQGNQQQQQGAAQGATRVQANQATDLSDLLRMVEEASLTQTQDQRDRLQRFRNNMEEREQLLNEMQQRRQEEESISADLETAYNENEVIKAQRAETLQEREGDLSELFGTVAGIVGDLRSSFEGSLISAQYQGRDEFLADLAAVLADDSDLPSTEELERMWFYMLQETTESGKEVIFNATVAQPDGSQNEQAVMRLGAFNIMSNGDYLQYDANTDRLSILPRQPASRVQNMAQELQNMDSGFGRVGIDPTGPTGGSFLAALISYPSWYERVRDNGGTIGRIILAFGAVALLFALERMFTLTLVGTKVKSQLKNIDNPKKNNPLGRVLMVYEKDKNMDIETLELKLGEAILQETPRLERFLTLLKIIATVAPLMGLLGTVVGMITVFQAITLFGTGDPQVMAGGISGALVTTVLGLVVAIPTVLLHTLVKSRSDRIVHILEEQATGIIARKAEAGRTKAA